MFSFLMVALLSTVFTLGLSRLIKNSAVVISVAALLSAAVFQVFVYLDLKYLDPFIAIAFVISGLLAAAVSALTLVVVRRRRPSRDMPDRP